MSIYLFNNDTYDGVKNIPLISINHLHVDINLSRYDYIIFTSKNAVNALHVIDKNWIKIPTLCVGEKTALHVEKMGAKAIHVSQKTYGDELAKEIIKNKSYKGKKFLFPSAAKIISDIPKLLIHSGLHVEREIIYETLHVKTKEEIDPNSFLIFTSPSIVKSFFESYKWHASNTAIAIGKKTAKYLPSNISLHVSTKQNISDCIKLAKNLQTGYN